ncbi:MAG: DUF2279 domain-containing protein [Gemmatimonadaceae bacterium]
MRPLLVVALMLQARAGAVGARPPHDSWFGADKVKHFFMSAFVQSLTYGTLRAAGARHDASLAGASAATAAVGVAKELRDRRAYGLFSVKDLTWDAAGVGVGTVLLRRTAR